MIIDEKLGAGSQVLSRTIFHGQHALNGLLEATDAKFKEELSLIVSLKTWQDVGTRARKKARALSKTVSELDGMIAIRAKDVEAIAKKFDSTKDAVAASENELRAKEEEVLQLTKKTEKEDDEIIDLESRRNVLNMSEEKIKLLEQKLQLLITIYEEDTHPIQLILSEINLKLKESKQILLNNQRQSDRHEAALESAQESLRGIEKKWGMTNTNSFTPPSVCPTCNQPIEDETSYGHMQSEMTSTMNATKEKIDKISISLTSSKEKITSLEDHIISLEGQKNNCINDLEQIEKDWRMRSKDIQNEVQAARADYSRLSSALSDDLKKLEHQNNSKQLEASAKAELTLYENRLEMFKQQSDTIKKDLEQMTENIESLKLDRETKRIESTTVSKAAEYFGARGIQTYVLQNTVLALQLVTQSYLDELSEGNLRLRLQLDDGDKISRTVSVLGPTGLWMDRPLSSLSG